MIKYTLPFLSLLLIFITGCSTDDPNPGSTPDPDPESEELTSEEVTSFLTDNSESVEEEGKVWRISDATLNNENASTSISTLPNVQDDEFIFKSDGTANGIIMQWRPRMDIKVDAVNSEQAKTDVYLSPVEFTGTVNEENPEILEFAEGQIIVEIVSEDEISLEIGKNADRATENKMTESLKCWSGCWDSWWGYCNSCYVSYTATPKVETSYDPIPSSLSFNEVYNMNEENVPNLASGSPGFTASLVENKLYWSYRKDNTDRLEHVVSYDLSSGTVEDCSTDQNAFVSKQLHVMRSGLKVIGGTRINTYPKDLEPTEAEPSCTPDSYTHGLELSRFGSAVMEGSLYIFGGDLNETNSDKIYRWDDSNKVLETIGTLPSPVSWANGDIVDGKLYIFGGQAQFSGTPAEDTIYIYNFETDSTEILHLPVPLFRSYVARDENLIYVAGQLEESRDIFFGVFNTIDKTFTEIPVSLDSSGDKTIHQMSILDNKVYVIYGGTDENGDPAGYSIQAAEI